MTQSMTQSNTEYNTVYLRVTFPFGLIRIAELRFGSIVNSFYLFLRNFKKVYYSR